jgi:protein TonB
VSRSLLLSLLCALILHSLLAWVDLDLFKRPIPVRDLPKSLTIDIAGPRPAKKPSAPMDPSILVKRPTLQKKIKRNVKPRPQVEPKIEDKKRIERQRPISKEKPVEKHEHLADLSPVDLPTIKKKDTFAEKDNHFAPDIVDIPMAPPKAKDIPNSPSHASITYALPIYQKNIPPQYPLLARRRGYQGKVLLELLVRKDGKVGSIRLARSSGYEALDRAAIKGVRNWLFQPAKRGDQLVEMWVKIPIRFQLK